MLQLSRTCLYIAKRLTFLFLVATVSVTFSASTDKEKISKIHTTTLLYNEIFTMSLQQFNKKYPSTASIKALIDALPAQQTENLRTYHQPFGDLYDAYAKELAALSSSSRSSSSASSSSSSSAAAAAASASASASSSSSASAAAKNEK